MVQKYLLSKRAVDFLDQAVTVFASSVTWLEVLSILYMPSCLYFLT